MIKATVRFAMGHDGKWRWVANAMKRPNGQLYGPAPKGESFVGDLYRGGRLLAASKNFTAVSDQDSLHSWEGTMVQFVLLTEDYRNVPCRTARGYASVCLEVLVSPLVDSKGCAICMESLDNLARCVPCKTVFSDLVTSELPRLGRESEIAEWQKFVEEQEAVPF